MLEGRGQLPSISKINKFRLEVDKFIENNNKLIGVHCTHGINRTGYMIEVCGINPAAAIEMFSNARKHKIERGLIE